MPILTKPPEWHNPGSEPPANKKQGGWEVDERPPAGWFNWLFHRTYQSLLELSAAIAGHRDNKNNPHSVTPSQIGAETPAGAQAKAEAALAAAKQYTDQEVAEVSQALDAHKSDASAHHTRYTNAEAVAAVKAADGAGSGFDADLLDGKHGSAYANASHSHGASDLPSASTSAKGIVQLSTSTSSTSTSLAATPSAVKAAYDLANSKADSVATVNNKKAGYAVYAP